MTKTKAPSPVPLTKVQKRVLKLCRSFLREPTSRGTLSNLCEALTSFELDAQFAKIYATNRGIETVRAEVKDLEICRDCRVKLDASNRANVSGYQCVTCKRKAHSVYVAQQRATKKAAKAAAEGDEATEAA